MTDRETNTLAAHGLKELFFQLCSCVSFPVVAGNRFWFYILTYVTSQIILRTNIFLIVVEVLRFLVISFFLCIYLHFWLWRKQFQVILTYHTSCTVVSFFVAAGNSFWLHRSVFWLWREIVLGVPSLPILPYQLCRCVRFLVAAGNSFWLLSF